MLPWLFALGCGSHGGSLKTTSTLPTDYSTGTAATLAGGMDADDVWLFGPQTNAPWLHYDGSTWSSVPLEEVKAALATEYPSCASTTAGQNAIYCSSGGGVLRVESTGAVTDVSAGLPTPTHPITTHATFNVTNGVVYVGMTDVGDPPSQAVYRLDGDSWVALPAIPGPVFSIVTIDDDSVWIGGTYPDPGANLEPDGYFATLEGSAWTASRFPNEGALVNLSRQVMFSPTDVWSFVTGGGVLTGNGGSATITPWQLGHYDGATWQMVEVPVSDYFRVEDGLSAGFGMARTESGNLALFNDNKDEIVMTEWDGSTVGESIVLGHYEWVDMAVVYGLTYLGNLADGTHVFLNANGREVLLGPLP